MLPYCTFSQWQSFVSDSPLMLFFIPDKLPKKVLVEEVMSNWVTLVGFKITHKSCILACAVVQDLLHVGVHVWIVSDILLVRKVNIKAVDRRKLLMDFELDHIPKSLTCTNVVSIKIDLNLMT